MQKACWDAMLLMIVCIWVWRFYVENEMEKKWNCSKLLTGFRITAKAEILLCEKRKSKYVGVYKSDSRFPTWIAEISFR